MKLTVVIALLAVVGCTYAAVAQMSVPGGVDNKPGQKAEIPLGKAKKYVRDIESGKQFFHVCDATNKDKCGAWVDAAGKKIPNATKTTIVGDNLVLGGVKGDDEGNYYADGKEGIAMVHLEVPVPLRG